jgi:hypothetical protein
LKLYLKPRLGIGIKANAARHRHSGIHHFSPVPEHCGAGLGLFFLGLDWFRHQHFFSFRYTTDRMPDSSVFRHSKKFHEGR